MRCIAPLALLALAACSGVDPVAPPAHIETAQGWVTTATFAGSATAHIAGTGSVTASLWRIITTNIPRGERWRTTYLTVWRGDDLIGYSGQIFGTTSDTLVMPWPAQPDVGPGPFRISVISDSDWTLEVQELR